MTPRINGNIRERRPGADRIRRSFQWWTAAEKQTAQTGSPAGRSKADRRLAETATADRRPVRPDAGVRSVRCIGDAEAPGLIAHAVYAGHRYARELEQPVTGEVPFKRHFHTADAEDLLRDR